LPNCTYYRCINGACNSYLTSPLPDYVTYFYTLADCRAVCVAAPTPTPTPTPSAGNCNTHLCSYYCDGSGWGQFGGTNPFFGNGCPSGCNCNAQSMGCFGSGYEYQTWYWSCS
jgi:hypothetical protein